MGMRLNALWTKVTNRFNRKCTIRVEPDFIIGANRVQTFLSAPVNVFSRPL